MYTSFHLLILLEISKLYLQFQSNIWIENGGKKLVGRGGESNQKEHEKYTMTLYHSSTEPQCYLYFHYEL